MIFKIDPSIKHFSQEELIVFSNALLRAEEKLHYLNIDFQTKRWIENNLFNNNLYLGRLAIHLLEENNEFWFPTALLRNNMRTVIVGKGNDFLGVDEMRMLVEEPAVVVLENGRYDWSVVKEWVELYTEERALKTINQHVDCAIKENRLRDHNAGGSGNVSNVITVLEPIYDGLPHLKIMTVFDSDKCSEQDHEDHHHSLKGYLREHKIEYHELEKREIENYFPIDTYRKSGLIVEGVEIPVFTDKEYDFQDLGNPIQSPFIKMGKKDVETLAKNITLKELKSRVTVVDGMDEVQRIILMLARFI